MKRSIRVNTKKRRPGRPRTTGKGTLIGVRMHKPALSAIDAWREAQPDKPSRPDAIRRMVEGFLAGAKAGR